jgi:adenosylcobinamide kinase/adenosylcobinamide-phosphate guanylyltransferase
MKTLILGGVRSGKSRLAERLALASGLPVIYVATARADDDGMRARIALHRGRRPFDWRVIEEPLALAAALSGNAAEGRCVIVDCLTLWLTQLLCARDETLSRKESEALLAVVPALPGEIVFIGNETNMGVMPMGELSRRYCDEAGVLHQRLAEVCDRVVLTVAGLPLVLKGEAV